MLPVKGSPSTAAFSGCCSWIGVRGHRSKVSVQCSLSLSKNNLSSFFLYGTPVTQNGQEVLEVGKDSGKREREGRQEV